MSKVYEFEATIHPVPDKGGAYVIFPYDGSIVNMGLKDEADNICYIIGVQKAIRVAIGKQAGDRVQVTIQERLE